GALDGALGGADGARGGREPLSIALHANAAAVHPELARRGVRFDVVTDQTSAHDMINGYVPAGLTVDEARALRAHDPEGYRKRACEVNPAQIRAMLEVQGAGALLISFAHPS